MQFLSWSLWNESILESPYHTRSYLIWQISVVVLIFSFGILGYCPKVKVVFEGVTLKISQGDRFTETDINLLTHCRIVSALEYYREWDHKANRYMTKIPDNVLLVFSDQGISAIGVNPLAHEFLIKAIRQVMPLRNVDS